MSDQDKYKKLIEWLNNPMMPLIERDALLPMFTSFFTPEEAEFLTGFPMSPTKLEDIAVAKDMAIEELGPKVKDLCRKGAIYEGMRGASVRYKLLDAGQIFLRMPFWTGDETETLKNTAHYANAYYMDGWYDNNNHITHKGLRSIPINKTIEDPRGIATFEDIVKIVENLEYHTVSHCPCRHRHKLDPDYQDSTAPSEVCLHFGELGRYTVENGMGREITKEETVEILKKAADAGMVHGISNQEENPDTICNCDPTYCTMFRPYHTLNHDKAMDQSNYQVVVTDEKCKACGLCIKRCPMDAIQMKVNAAATNKFGKSVVVDTNLCIGCGVCVHKCAAHSITLERRDETTYPPKTGRDWAMLAAKDVMAAKAK